MLHYREVLSALPKELYRKNPAKAWTALFVDFAMFLAFSAVVIKIDNYFIGGLFGLVMIGLVLTGLFVVGHDAGHRSFTDNERVNDVVGHLTTSFLGWPFHLWRLAHNVHHLHTNNVKKDVAWEPHTNDQIGKLPGWYSAIYTTVRSSVLAFWMASFFHNVGLWLNYFQGKFYKPEDRLKVGFSILVAVIATGGYLAASYALAGWYGVVTLFLLPQIGFYFWLTIFTLLHHTHPELNFLSEDQWNKTQAQLHGTVNVRYGKFIDFFTHDIAWHVPHHVSVGIPFYNLKAAHKELSRTFPNSVRDQRFTMRHLLAVLGHCQAVETFQNPLWTNFTGKKSPVAVVRPRIEPTQSASG